MQKTRTPGLGDLIYGLSDRVVERTMEEKLCFRTEVRDSGHYVCGIHTSASEWKGESDGCPDAVYAGSVASGELWRLIEELQIPLDIHGGSEDDDFGL